MDRGFDESLIHGGGVVGEGLLIKDKDDAVTLPPAN
jgi:hypothetical protein